MNVIELSRASFGYGRGRPVLSDVTFSVAEGSFVGVAGPNGSGKTSLLRAILGLLPPRAGTVRVFGETARPGRGAIGYLPQNRPSSLPPVRGIDLLAVSLPGAWFGVKGREERASIQWALEQVDAEALAARPLTRLSGGERRRVLIAEALLGKPRLLLLDEPLAGLDPVSQANTIRLLSDLRSRLGLTILCIAHELNVLLPAVDEVLTIVDGRAKLGPVDALLSGPALTRLYGAPTELIRQNGRIFVVPGA